MPKAAWHKVHLVSYGVAVLVTVHALTAGSDVTALPVRVVLVGSAFGALVVSGLRARQVAIAADARANQTPGQPVPASTGAIGSWSVPARPPVVVPPRAPSCPDTLGAPRPDGPPTASPNAPPAPYGVDR